MLKPHIPSRQKTNLLPSRQSQLITALQSLLHELHAHCKVTKKWLEEGSLFFYIGCDSLLPSLLDARVWSCVAIWEESGNARMECLPCILSLSMHRDPVWALPGSCGWGVRKGPVCSWCKTLCALRFFGDRFKNTALCSTVTPRRVKRLPEGTG